VTRRKPFPGILLWDYIKDYEQPETLVRAQLDRGELRYTWKSNGNLRASDDGGPQPPKGWWLATLTTIDRETSEVRGQAHLAPFFPAMSFVRVFPAVAPKSKAKGRPGIKFGLVLEILADIKPAPGLQPSEIEKKVLPKFQRRWAKLRPGDQAKLGPDGRAKPPVSRRQIYRAYQQYLNPDK
jgi:hypothetical protein